MTLYSVWLQVRCSGVSAVLQVGAGLAGWGEVLDAGQWCPAPLLADHLCGSLICPCISPSFIMHTPINCFSSVGRLIKSWFRIPNSFENYTFSCRKRIGFVRSKLGLVVFSGLVLNPHTNSQCLDKIDAPRFAGKTLFSKWLARLQGNETAHCDDPASQWRITLQPYTSQQTVMSWQSQLHCINLSHKVSY